MNSGFGVSGEPKWVFRLEPTGVVVLSERERRALACIERHLMDSDPDLVRLFRGAGPGDTGATPRFLLYAGLALLVLGGLVSAVPVALTGMVLAMFALVIAHVRPTGPAWPSTA